MAFGSDITSPRSLLRGRHLPVPCKVDTYQYPLQSRHLPVPFAKPTPTSIRYIAIIYQYPMVRDYLFNIVQGADFSIVQGAIFSIVRAVIFSIVQGDTFVEMLHKLLDPGWRCNADRSEVLGEAWRWWRLCGELNLWVCRIARMRLCAVSGDRVTWPHYYNCFPSRTRALTSV